MSGEIHRLESQHMNESAIDAIPGAVTEQSPEALHVSPSASSKRAPSSSYLTHALPEEAVMIALLDTYFESVHWFSLVILESKFRPPFDAIRAGTATQSDKPFLLLLSTMLGLAAWYRSRVFQRNDDHPPEFWQDWSERLLANSESQVIDLMDQNSIIAVQTLILLGSFYVYHGRPNLSFSLLGATVKSAQAGGLHREPRGASAPDLEERRRVWWTIYTWDRYVISALARDTS
jgi:hypothetical protein